MPFSDIFFVSGGCNSGEEVLVVTTAKFHWSQFVLTLLSNIFLWLFNQTGRNG